jgi:hypothetical protein
MDSSNSTRRTTRSSQRTGIAENLMSITRGLTAPQASTSRTSPHLSDYALLSEPNDPNDTDPAVTANHQSPPPDNPNEQPDPEDDPDPEPDPDEDPDDAPNLARSLALLAHKIGGITATPKPTSIKPRTPDTFDGSDSAKLDTFIFQCSMYISARAQDFPNDESRVTFTLSFLKGTPLEWFQTELNHSMTQTAEFPTWFTSYTLFLSELQRLFGPRDPVNDAMTALEALRYKDSQKATRYSLEFNRHSRRTGWNEVALARLYYKGLPDRLKDEISRIGKPAGLLDLQDLVATLDQRYWERQAEISRDKKPSNAQPQKSNDKSSDNRSDNRSSSSQNANAKGGNQQQQSKGKDQKKPSSGPSNSSNSGGKATSIADILGPDGKLKPEERQRRMDNKLCLRCGGTGHIAHDCPKPSSSKPKPKARAATVAASSSSTATPATSSASGKA